MQNKKNSSKNSSYKKRKDYKWKDKKKFKYERFLKILKTKSYSISNRFLKKVRTLKRFSHKLNILVLPNNIFCSLVKFNSKKTLYSCSSEKYKLKISKRKLKHTYKLVLDKFFSTILKKFKFRDLIINLTSPIRIRKKIIKYIPSKFQKKSLFFKINRKKSFNGCRPPKKVRKKRKGWRFFK